MQRVYAAQKYFDLAHAADQGGDTECASRPESARDQDHVSEVIPLGLQYRLELCRKREFCDTTMDAFRARGDALQV